MSSSDPGSYFQQAIDFLCSLSRFSEWDDLSGELVMDIGCGCGKQSTEYIRVIYPKVAKVIAIDNEPNIVREARRRNEYRNIEYHVADITNSVSMQRWSNVSKMVSIRYITFIENQELAFSNMFKLLKPGGLLGLSFTLASADFDYTFDMLEHPKWKTYLNKLAIHAESHSQKLEASHYTTMLKGIGFTVVFFEEETKEYVYQSDKDFIEETIRSPMYPLIPQEFRIAFIASSLSTFLRHNPRNSEEKLCFEYKVLKALLKKT